MVLLENLQQFDIAVTDFFISLASGSLLLFFLLAALCAPFAAVTTESLYKLRRKVFYDKCALQMTQLATGLAVFLFSLMAATFIAILSIERPEFFLTPPPWEAIRDYVLPWLPPTSALVLILFYLLSWNLLKKVRWLHIPLGLLAALVCMGLLFAAFLLLGAFQEPVLTLFFQAAPQSAFMALWLDFLQSPTMWLGLGYAACFGFAACGALTQLWLIMRRAKADYGRDYYVFAMHYCARIALFFTLAATVLAGLIFWRLREFTPPVFSQPQDIGLILIAAGMPLSCCLLWFCICKSETPLRHKPGAFFALLFSVIALCAQLSLFFNAFPML